MAYVPLTPEEEELLKQQNAGAPLEVAGTAGTLTPQSAGKSPNQLRMTPFTDVASYLDANKEQGIGLGQKVADKLSTEAGEAKSAADQVQGSFQSAVDKGTFRPNQAEIDAAAADPVKYASDTEKAGKFTAAAQGTYTGPKLIEEIPEYATAQTKAAEANRKSNLTGTMPGRQELVSGFQKNPTRGLTAFDAMIFGQTPEAITKVKDTISSFGDLENYLSGKAAEAGTFAGQAEADRVASQKLIEDKFLGENGVIPGLKNEVNSAVESRRTALSNLISGLPGSLGDYNWTPEELQALGINESAVSGLGDISTELNRDYGVNVSPSSYYSQEVIPDYVTPENTITPEQIAKYNALSGLIGQTPDYITEEQRAAAPQVPTKVGNLDINSLRGTLQNTVEAKRQILPNYKSAVMKDIKDAFEWGARTWGGDEGAQMGANKARGIIRTYLNAHPGVEDVFKRLNYNPFDYDNMTRLAEVTGTIPGPGVFVGGA